MFQLLIKSWAIAQLYNFNYLKYKIFYNTEKIQNGYKLISIPYLEYENIEEILQEELKRQKNRLSIFLKVQKNIFINNQKMVYLGKQKFINFLK